MADPQSINSGSFIPTTGTRDQTKQGIDSVLSLRENINTIALALNTKDSGFYARTEFINGQVWFPDPSLTSASGQNPTLRQVFRLVVLCPTLPAAAGTTTVAHGLTVDAALSWTRIYGTATDPAGFIGLPLPYASPTAADVIEVWVDVTNINIKVGKDRSAFTKNYVILEFIKQ